MVEPPRQRVSRNRPSRRQTVARRLAVIVVLLALLATAGGAAALALRSVREASPPPPPPPPPATQQPAVEPLRIVFPEGFTRKEMAERVRAVKGIAREKRGLRTAIRVNEYLKLTSDVRLPDGFRTVRQRGSLEGFLFPATYEFLPKTTTRDLVDMQLETFEREWARVDLREARRKNLTPYDVLIIASMVEKETTVAKERPLVAAVIWNRLRVGLPLGIDATVRYGLDVPGNESLRQSHLDSDSPYNTRKRLGLTPTPIANPGLASMKAAAKPADVDFLYFVRKPDSVEHFFTASESEFFQKACEYGYGCG